MGFSPKNDEHWRNLEEILRKAKEKRGCSLSDREADLLFGFDDWCREQAGKYFSDKVSTTTLRGALNCALRVLGATEDRRVGLLEFSRWAGYVAARREASFRRAEADFLRHCSELALNHAKKGLSGLAFTKTLEGLVAYYGSQRLDAQGKAFH